MSASAARNRSSARVQSPRRTATRPRPFSASPSRGSNSSASAKWPAARSSSPRPSASTPDACRARARGCSGPGAVAQRSASTASRQVHDTRRSGHRPGHRPAAAFGCVGAAGQPRSQRTVRAPAGDIATVIAPSRSVRSTRAPRAAYRATTSGAGKRNWLRHPSEITASAGATASTSSGARRGPAAVVRDLQHVRGDDLSDVAPPGQLALAVGLQIAREQDAASREPDAQHQRRVVHGQPGGRGDALAGAVGRALERAERDDRGAAEPCLRDVRRRDGALARERDEAPVLGVVPVVAAGPEGADVETLEDAEQAVQMIGVGVRQRDDVDRGRCRARAGTARRCARPDRTIRRARRRRRSASRAAPGASTTAASPWPTSRNVTVRSRACRRAKSRTARLPMASSAAASAPAADPASRRPGDGGGDEREGIRPRSAPRSRARSACGTARGGRARESRPRPPAPPAPRTRRPPAGAGPAVARSRRPRRPRDPPGRPPARRSAPAPGFPAATAAPPRRSDAPPAAPSPRWPRSSPR